MWNRLKIHRIGCNNLFLHMQSASPASKHLEDRHGAIINGDISAGTPAFSHARIGEFVQDRPVLHNPYLHDSLLKSYIRRVLPKKHFREISEELTRLGDRVVKEIDSKGLECELNPPTLTQYDAWGKRVDQVNTCEAWKSMKKISAEEGLVAIAYERKYGEASRLYQMAKLYLFCPSSGLYSCPLAMTDGAAKVLENVVNNLTTNDEMLANAYRRLTSRDENRFWTSGQWMTEKRGGSDVANGTETVAVEQADGSFHLYGYKWFTSASDADVALTLARIADQNGKVDSGTRGLSMFFLETRGNQRGINQSRRMDSGLNGIELLRLKDKLGTRPLPTAEMLLDGTVAYQVGSKSQGIRQISDMLTVTRIHNSLWSAAGMKRLLQLAVDYSHKRTAFGSKLSNKSLHVQALARMDVESRSAFLLVFEIIRLLGLEEVGIATKRDMNVLRILTPVCKLYTAKQALSVCTESLESFGGIGYLEDSGLPRYLRDAQVLSIWEGTTSVLSMDVLRAIEKSGGEVLTDFTKNVNEKLTLITKSHKPELVHASKAVEAALKNLMEFVETVMGENLVLAARDLSYSIARIYMGVLLLEHAVWEGADMSDAYAAKRWCEQELCPVMRNFASGCYDDEAKQSDKQLVYS